MVTLEQMQSGILRYVVQDIAPNLSKLEQIAVGGTINLLSDKLPALIDNFMDNKLFDALEVYDKETGRMDIDAIYKAYKPFLGADPISIPVKIPFIGIDLNLKFTQRDIETLYRYIMEA